MRRSTSMLPPLGRPRPFFFVASCRETRSASPSAASPSGIDSATPADARQAAAADLACGCSPGGLRQSAAPRKQPRLARCLRLDSGSPPERMMLHDRRVVSDGAAAWRSRRSSLTAPSGCYCGRARYLVLGLVQLPQTGLMRRGFFGSCSRRHTAQVTSIRLGGDILGTTSISGAQDRSRPRSWSHGFQ